MIDTFTGKEIVLPFYISETKKDDFEYSKVPQVAIFRVLNALEDEEFETFEVWQVDDKEIICKPFPGA